MIIVLWALLFAVLTLRHALECGLGRDAVIGILFGSTLGLSCYASAPWGQTVPGQLPVLTIAVAAAGMVAGNFCRRILLAEDSLR